MRSYPYIQGLFKNIFAQSRQIGGRFHVSKNSGTEINADDLGEVLKDEVAPAPYKKYPLALMLPPTSTGNYTDNNGEWEKYSISIFFLAPAYYDGNNQLLNLNTGTQTSMHTVPDTWHDMKRCAVDFLRVLAKVQRSLNLVNDQFRLVQTDKFITPVSMVGVDGACGVRLQFQVSVFIGCELEDYTPEGIDLITAPVADSHPAHNM